MNLEGINLTNIVDTGVSTLMYCVAALILLAVGMLVFKLLNRKTNVNDELVEKDNFAFAIQYVGYLLGLLLSIGGAIVGESLGVKEDLINIAIYGGMGIVLLNIASLISDKVILNKFSVQKEVCDDKNEGVGVVAAANSIASGLIVFSAVQGEGGGIETAVVCWGVGQLLLILASLFYNLMTPYDIHHHLEKDNVAVGIGFAGAIVAFSILISNAISGDFEGYQSLAINLSFEFVIGMLLLPLIRIAADKLILVGQNLDDELVNQTKPNLGAGLIEAFAYVGGAILISWCI
tara:strand:+ start:1770 stop:2642 length:873 start_codon:yes stop_codon:yes gene_type:complete